MTNITTAKQQDVCIDAMRNTSRQVHCRAASERAKLVRRAEQCWAEHDLEIRRRKCPGVCKDLVAEYYPGKHKNGIDLCWLLVAWVLLWQTPRLKSVVG